MAAPTTPIIDPFSSPVDPLPAPWALLQVGTSTMKIASGSCVSSSSYASAARTDLVFGDGEAYVGSPDGDACYMMVRQQVFAIGDVLWCYGINWFPPSSGTINLYRWDDNVGTLIAGLDAGVAIVSTDQMWLRPVGTRIDVYHKGNLQGGVNDATYASGVPGLLTSNTSVGFTNFGGGGFTGTLTSVDLTRFPKAKLATVAA